MYLSNCLGDSKEDYKMNNFFLTLNKVTTAFYPKMQVSEDYTKFRFPQAKILLAS